MPSDSECAEVVIQIIYQRLLAWADGGPIDQVDFQTGALRDLLFQQKTFLADMFRAARGGG